MAERTADTTTTSSSCFWRTVAFADETDWVDAILQLFHCQVVAARVIGGVGSGEGSSAQVKDERLRNRVHMLESRVVV